MDKVATFASLLRLLEYGASGISFQCIWPVCTVSSRCNGNISSCLAFHYLEVWSSAEGRAEALEAGAMGGRSGELQLGPTTMAAMVAAWALTYVLTRLLLPKRSKDFCNRCVSLIHVVVSMYFSSNSVGDWSRPLDGVGGPSTHPQMLAVTVSLAYFIYDTICCAVELPFSWEMSVHHAVSILGLAFGYLRQVSGTELVACVMLMEVSNPFMHGRELLKKLKLKDSPLSLANDVVFALVFTVARICSGPVVVYKCVVSPSSPFAVKVGAVGMQAVSLLWFYKIARMVVYKLSKPKAPFKAA